MGKQEGLRWREMGGDDGVPPNGMPVGSVASRMPCRANRADGAGGIHQAGPLRGRCASSKADSAGSRCGGREPMMMRISVHAVLEDLAERGAWRHHTMFGATGEVGRVHRAGDASTPAGAVRDRRGHPVVSDRSVLRERPRSRRLLTRAESR